MMQNPPRRRGPDTTSLTVSGPSRIRPKRQSISKVETLETRQLLATAVAAAPIAPPPPTGAPEVQPPVNATPGPRVAFVQFQPLTGRVLVSLTGDLAGYNTATLTNPANYSFGPVREEVPPPLPNRSRPNAGVVLAPTFKVTGATLANIVQPGMPQQLIISINNNQPLRNGTYQFTIHSAAITDLAGRPLDGAYSGVFPSGNGQPGGDFVANLTSVRNTVLPAAPVTMNSAPPPPGSVKPTFVYIPVPHAVIVGITSASPGGFMLAGGNKIKLYALPNQNFPGSFRPRTPVIHGKATPHASTK